MRDFRNDQYALFFLILWVQWTLFFIFCIYLFFTYRRSIYIRCRDPWLIFCSALGQYLMMTLMVWKIVVTPDKWPNMLNAWFIWLCIPLHLLPYPVRSLRFILQHALNEYEFDLSKPESERKKGPNKFLDFLKKNPKYRSDKAFFILNWILMAIAIAIGIYRSFLPENRPGQYGEKNSAMYHISCIALLVLASFFLWLAVHFLRKTDEELFITVELAFIGAVWLVFISLYIFFGWSDIGTFRTPPIFLIVLCIASFLVSFGMPIQLSIVIRSEKSFGDKKYDNFNEVLNNPETYSLLVQFCKKKLCLEFVLFYEDVNKYKSLDPEKLEEKYADMVDKYVEDEAPFHINVHVDVLKKVMEEDHPNPETFNEMLEKALHLMQVEIFREFKRSTLLKNYINKQKRKDILQRN